jgi:hypothetical protein
MTDYFSAHKWKLIAGIVVFLLGSTSGFLIRPLFDKIALSYADKPYVAPVSDFDKSVNEYFTSTNHQAKCMAEAKAQVSMDLAGKYLGISKEEQQKVSQYELRAVNGISDQTATRTISLETKQGRR